MVHAREVKGKQVNCSYELDVQARSLWARNPVHDKNVDISLL